MREFDRSGPKYDFPIDHSFDIDDSDWWHEQDAQREAADLDFANSEFDSARVADLEDDHYNLLAEAKGY